MRKEYRDGGVHWTTRGGAARGSLPAVSLPADETTQHTSDKLYFLDGHSHGPRRGEAMTTNGSLPPVDVWQAQTMRVTVFPTEVVSLEPSSWWDKVVGVPPEAVGSRPKVGQFQARGDFEGRQLVLQIQPGRVEWILGPLAKAVDEESTLPSLGSFSEVLQSLSKVVVSWLPQAPALQRFAFGAILTQPVDNVLAGYALLQKYLASSVRLDPESSSDFFYQINRPRPSRTTIAGLRLNRLTKWSVQVVRRMTMTIGTEGGATRALGQDAACRLELDMNTAPDFTGALPADQLGSLLQELIDLGREIAQKGDIQ
jgi:hypothetical protein